MEATRIGYLQSLRYLLDSLSSVCITDLAIVSPNPKCCICCLMFSNCDCFKLLSTALVEIELLIWRLFLAVGNDSTELCDSPISRKITVLTVCSNCLISIVLLSSDCLNNTEQRLTYKLRNFYKKVCQIKWVKKYLI